ncbi:MAG: DUF5655 domain-containing protein [Oscillospiraceae bacterium]|nr:DUF5655 domain-containing protein [Oscillospiraceae bacterium]
MFKDLNLPKIQDNSSYPPVGEVKKGIHYKFFIEQFDQAPERLKQTFLNIRDYINSLGDDIKENQLRYYVAYKKARNIVCIQIHQRKILVYLRLDPDAVELEDNFIDDVRDVGHCGTGDLKLTIKSNEDFEKVKYLIDRAYYEN